MKSKVDSYDVLEWMGYLLLATFIGFFPWIFLYMFGLNPYVSAFLVGAFMTAPAWVPSLLNRILK